MGRCSDTSKTTHVTSLLQLMSLYRRNNRSSDPCSAIALVVPVALEYWKPGSTKKVAPPTLQALAAWQSGGTWRIQFCCSYWYPSSVQGSPGWKQRKSRVGVGASRVVGLVSRSQTLSSFIAKGLMKEERVWLRETMVGYSCSLRTSLTFSKNCVISCFGANSNTGGGYDGVVPGAATGTGYNLIGPNWWILAPAGKVLTK